METCVRPLVTTRTISPQVSIKTPGTLKDLLEDMFGVFTLFAVVGVVVGIIVCAAGMNPLGLY